MAIITLVGSIVPILLISDFSAGCAHIDVYVYVEVCFPIVLVVSQYMVSR